jgi:hypothetical protein
MWIKSSNEMDEPKRDIPYIEIEDPMRLNDRSDNEEPIEM